MDWDVILLAVAAYVAVTSLVRLMRSRRDQLVGDVQRQIKAHKQQARAAEAAKDSDKLDAA